MPIVAQGCEDAIQAALCPETLPHILRWAATSVASPWVHRYVCLCVCVCVCVARDTGRLTERLSRCRQAMRYLRDEFPTIMSNAAAARLPRAALAAALGSPFTQCSEAQALRALLRLAERGKQPGSARGPAGAGGRDRAHPALAQPAPDTRHAVHGQWRPSVTRQQPRRSRQLLRRGECLRLASRAGVAASKSERAAQRAARRAHSHCRPATRAPCARSEGETAATRARELRSAPPPRAHSHAGQRHARRAHAGERETAASASERAAQPRASHCSSDSAPAGGGGSLRCASAGSLRGHAADRAGTCRRDPSRLDAACSRAGWAGSGADGLSARVPDVAMAPQREHAPAHPPGLLPPAKEYGGVLQLDLGDGATHTPRPGSRAQRAAAGGSRQPRDHAQVTHAAAHPIHRILIHNNILNAKKNSICCASRGSPSPSNSAHLSAARAASASASASASAAPSAPRDLRDQAARMVPTDARTAPGASREPRTESLISARSSPRTTESPRRAHTNTYTHTHIYSQYYADFMRVKIVDNFF
ncbi:hypothetical protein MSG28_016108 [Choristoneura fumiferana]|uniref:Uncharacterized protein n=1 Tax=Choristoneura fumiferana TaxID=7141 RepID=A0ACC0K5C1_CHOFU|nr:hypothetical protein MSG28_016108 [Choristoneura fumiferana]